MWMRVPDQRDAECDVKCDSYMMTCDNVSRSRDTSSIIHIVYSFQFLDSVGHRIYK